MAPGYYSPGFKMLIFAILIGTIGLLSTATSAYAIYNAYMIRKEQQDQQ